MLDHAGAVGDVILEHLRVPAGKRFLAFEVFQRRFFRGPAIAPHAADFGGRH